MLQGRGVSPVLAVLRAVGGFPYTWRPSQQTADVRLSWVAAAWSIVVVTVMVTFCVASITMNYMWRHEARNIMRDILVTYWYILVTLLYLYLIVHAHRLARVLRLLAAAGVSVWRRSWGREDAPVMAAVMMFLTGSCLSVSFTESSSSLVGEVLKQVGDRTADFTITVLLTVFYALVKLLSVEMEATVAVLAHATTPAPGVAVGGDLVCHTPDTNTQLLQSPYQHHITNTLHPQALTQHRCTPRNKVSNVFHTNMETQEQALRSPPPSGRPSKPPATGLLPLSPVLQLLALDDILREVVGYASPPLLLLLLNASASTTMFLYSAIATRSFYYVGFISVLVARMVLIVLIPDQMIRKVHT